MYFADICSSPQIVLESCAGWGAQSISYSLIAKIRPPPNSPVQVPITDLLGPNIKAPVGLSAGMLARENRCSFQEPPDFAGNEHERARRQKCHLRMT
jgi:hypothetical protein